MSFDIVISTDMQNIINNVIAKKICNILKFGKFSYYDICIFENNMMNEVLKPQNYKSKFLKDMLNDDYVKFNMLGDTDKYDLVTVLFFCYNKVCYMLGIEYIFNNITELPDNYITKFNIRQLKYDATLFSLVMSSLNTY
jgi:hypothetical protein